MTHEFLQLPAVTFIGLEAEGILHDCQHWLAQHWMEFHRRAFELAHLQRSGVWGLMSDSEIHLAPWGGERGRYLACWQVPQGTEGFRDWQVWELPAMHWMRIPCLLHEIPQAIDYAKDALKNHPDWRWEGSIHESYPDGFRFPSVDAIHLMVGLLPR